MIQLSAFLCIQVEMCHVIFYIISARKLHKEEFGELQRREKRRRTGLRNRQD